MPNIFCNCHADGGEGKRGEGKLVPFINLTYDFGELWEAVLLDSFWT